MALIVLCPIFILIAIIIKITSPGKVFYKGIRAGRNNIDFRIYKFRTMVQDAENIGGPSTALNDFRLTKIGRFLRRYKLDELPQFINIIKGEMSLVGPRPERAYFVKEFRKTVPGYMLRHKVKSGLTGWAQIHGLRGDTSIEKRIEMDLDYIQKWSLALDIKILFLTLYRGFMDPNER